VAAALDAVQVDDGFRVRAWQRGTVEDETHAAARDAARGLHLNADVAHVVVDRLLLRRLQDGDFGRLRGAGEQERERDEPQDHSCTHVEPPD